MMLKLLCNGCIVTHGVLIQDPIMTKFMPEIIRYSTNTGSNYSHLQRLLACLPASLTAREPHLPGSGTALACLPASLTAREPHLPGSLVQRFGSYIHQRNSELSQVDKITVPLQRATTVETAAYQEVHKQSLAGSNALSKRQVVTVRRGFPFNIHTSPMS